MDTGKHQLIPIRQDTTNGVTGHTQYQPSNEEIVSQVIKAFEARARVPVAAPSPVPGTPEELPPWADALIKQAARKVPAWVWGLVGIFGSSFVAIASQIGTIWHLPGRVDSIERDVNAIACAVGAQGAHNCERQPAAPPTSQPTRQP